MSKSNSNKIELSGGRGQHYLILYKISTLQFQLLGLFKIFNLIKQYFPRKRLKKIYFSISIDNRRPRPNKKKI